MNIEEEFTVEEEWVEEDFIDCESYEEEVMEEDVVEDKVIPVNVLQRATGNTDLSLHGSSIVEFDFGSYNGQSSSGEGEPDKYEEACRTLIKQVYSQGASHDEDDMIRRCDARNLYRNLMQQHKFLVHSKKALAETDRIPEKWESFDDSNGALSVEAVDQAVISFDEPLQELEAARGTDETGATQDQSMMEAQGTSSEGELIPWLLRHADDPDDYEAACRELIPIVYKDEDEIDVDTMLRRSDAKDLYRHLKHQHWYLTHTGAISEKPESNGKTEMLTIYNKGPSLDGILLVTEEENEIKGETKERSQNSNIMESTKANDDVNAMDKDPPAQDLAKVINNEQSLIVVDCTVRILSDTGGEAFAQTRQNGDSRRSLRETEEHQGGVVKWLDRYADDPDDYEEASRKLVSVLYSTDDEYDAETTLNRSNPKDLFRYLKQQYWYRVHMGTLAENALEQRLFISSVPSATAPKPSERTKLMDTVRNRISKIESTKFMTLDGKEESHAASSTSPFAENSDLMGPKWIELELTQSPASELIQAADKPSSDKKHIQQTSSLATHEGVVSYDGMESSDSSLEPPPGYDSQTLIKDRVERLEKACRDDEDVGKSIHKDSQNLEGSSRTDASSVFSHQNRIDEIIMDVKMRHAILDQMNQDEAAKLHEPDQGFRENTKSKAAAVAVHSTARGLPEHISRDVSDGSDLVDANTSNLNVSSSRSRVEYQVLQRSKRNGVIESSGLSSNKRARNETESWPHSREQQDVLQQKNREQGRSQDGEIILSEIRNVAVNVETMGDEEIRMWGTFNPPSIAREGIQTEKVYTHYDQGVVTEKLGVDGDDVQSIGVEENGKGQSSEHLDHGVATGKLHVDRDDVQSIGDEEIGTGKAFEYHGRGVIPGKLKLGGDDVQVGGTNTDKASGDRTTSLHPSATDKEVISLSISTTNESSEDNDYQMQHPHNSSSLNHVDMAKRLNRIEDELFLIVSDAEKILGEPLSEEMLAALILAATKTSHLKRYYNFDVDAFVFLPRVANAVLDGSLLDCASRHIGDETVSQYVDALTSASEKIVDRNFDYVYMESNAVTLDIAFPRSTEVAQKPEKSSSSVNAEECIVPVGPLDSDKQEASPKHHARVHELNTSNNKALNDGDRSGLNLADLTKLEEEAELLFANYQVTKAALLRESAEIDRKRNLEMDRIGRGLDILEGSRKQAASSGATKEKDMLAKHLKDLKENLAASKGHLEQARSRQHSSVSSGENSIRLFGIFGVKRRATDLEKEKERQAKLMRQKIHELEIQQSMEQIEREIANVQTRYDELPDQESSFSQNEWVDIKTTALLQESRELEEKFLQARNDLVEGLHALEERRVKDETWYRREKAAILARFPPPSCGIEVDRSASHPTSTHEHDSSPPFQTLYGEEVESAEPKSKLESNKNGSAKVTLISGLPEGTCSPEAEGRSTKDGDDASSTVETRKDPSGIFPDSIEDVNQPVVVLPSALDLLASVEHHHLSQKQPRPRIQQLVPKAKGELMQEPHKSSMLAEGCGILSEENGTVSHIRGSEGVVQEHLIGLDQPGSQVLDQVSLASLKAEEASGYQCEEYQLLDKDQCMKTADTNKEGNGKKILMLFSSTIVDHLQRTNQHRAVIVLKAQKINYETMDGSNPNAFAKRNELLRISNLREYPQFFIVEGGAISFVGTFENIQELNDRGLLKSLVDSREEHYRQDFMELLECDDRGEMVDEDRLYHLQLYARRRVGEELSESERFDLEEFEREEAKLESAESPHDSVWQGVVAISAKAERGDSFDVLEHSSLGHDRGIGIEHKNSSPIVHEDVDGPSGSSLSLLHVEPMDSQSPPSPSQATNSDRSLAWRKNGKRMVAEKLQASMPQGSLTIMRNGPGRIAEREVETDILLASKASLQDQSEKRADETITNELVTPKASLPDQHEKMADEKKSRKEILAAKRKQIVESRRAKWGLKSEINTATEETLKAETSHGATFESGSSLVDEKKKQRMEESKRLAEKTAKARQARLAREAELQRYTKEAKQKGCNLGARLEKQSSAQEDDAAASLDNRGAKPVSRKESLLLPPLIKEVERLSGLISRYEKKLETTCKSIFSVVQKTGLNADMQRIVNLGLPEMFNHVTDQPWFKEHASDTFSRPMSVSKRGKESVARTHVAGSNKVDHDLAEGFAKPCTVAHLNRYKLSKLGEKFIAIDGPGCGDTGRFLASLAASESVSMIEIRDRWLDISRIAGDSQSARINKNIEEMISFCSSSGLIE